MTTRTWTSAARRPRRALYLSSPIGLGHARRDLAIAQQLGCCTRTCRSTGSPSTRSPGCWRTPASGCTRRRPGWPASRRTSRPSPASTTSMSSRPSGRWTRSWSTTSWSSTTSSEETAYDLVIGDEAWDVDYFLHENPELKRFSFAWLTDFVGWLPMPDLGEREAAADRGLQRRDAGAASSVRRIRDRQVFVGNPDGRGRRVVRAGPAEHPRVDDRPLRLRGLHHRVRAADG